MYSGILTIDDIASKNTPAIVDYLRSKNIRAILFATGENVLNHYEEALYAVRGGMVVGNHSYSHPAFSSLTMQQATEEIEKCEDVLNRLYADAGVARKYRPFRFPYGDKGGEKKAQLQAYLRSHGFHKVKDTALAYPWWDAEGHRQDIDTFWTFDFAEYNIREGSGFTKENVWQRMHDTSPGSGAVLFGENNRHLLLLHAHDETDALLPRYYAQFIDHLLENGFVFDEPEFV